MRPIVTAAEMRALDQATIEEIGIPGVVLMETAGRAVADAVVAQAPAGPVVVVAGAGNNGGDGHVAARVLRERGADAVVLLVAPRDAIRGDARLHLDALERCGGVVHDASTPAALEAHAGALAGAAVIVDAMFGTGLGRPVEGHLADVIAKINASDAIIVAADLPSGLDADTGRELGAAVDADVTVTMAALKIALVSAPGFTRAGEVRVAEIGIPRSLAIVNGVRAGLIEEADVRAIAPRPAPMDHKGRRGHVLVVAGSPGKRGAGRLAAAAALRAGAGLVTLAGASPGEPREIDAPDPVMTALCDDPGALRALAAGKDAIVIGPGMRRDDVGVALVDAALALGIPLVVDADALNQLGAIERLADAAGPVVITPHPGEAGRLLGRGAATIEADRFAAVRTLASRSRATCVLKGARTLICDGTLGDEFVSVNPTGGPALASGGTGDVLAGAIGALLAQGLAPVDAARLGTWVHGEAGSRAGVAHGVRGATATDVVAEIGRILDSLSSP